MKSKKLILALTATLIMGLGVTAYAATTDGTNTQNSEITTAHQYDESHCDFGEGSSYGKGTTNGKGQGINNKTSESSTHSRASLRRITGYRGYEFIETVLKNKLGVTDEEIQASLDAGKSLHDLALEKGMTEEEFKNALLEEKNNAIVKAVSEGSITQEEGDTAKSIISSNAENADCSNE